MRKDKIIEEVDKYIKVRSEIYDAITSPFQHNIRDLNQKKHEFLNKIFDLLGQTESGDFYKKFQEIVTFEIPGCSIKDMRSYLINKNANSYKNCLELQKNSIINLVDDFYKPKITIVDHDEGIMICAGLYQDGVCYTE